MKTGCVARTQSAYSPSSNYPCVYLDVVFLVKTRCARFARFPASSHSMLTALNSCAEAAPLGEGFMSVICNRSGNPICQIYSIQNKYFPL